MQLIDTKWIDDVVTPTSSCVVGVSGGIDSMVLLHWISQNLDKFSVPIKVMHINHKLHPDSDKWANFVKMTCDNLNLPVEIKDVVVSNYGKNVEFAARTARYTEFCNSGADILILAHHMNDQIETFFLKLFRGSGIRGLKSMPTVTPCWFDNNVKVVRPLLNVSRSTVEAYAAYNDIKHVEDPSNKNMRYDRNYIRNAIWPVIVNRFDIADINIAKSIDLLGESWELTTILAQQDMAACSNDDGSLHWPKVKDLGTLRIKNLILHILGIHNVYGYSIGHIEQFSRGLVSATSDSKNELALNGFKLRKHGHRINIEIENNKRTTSPSE